MKEKFIELPVTPSSLKTVCNLSKVAVGISCVYVEKAYTGSRLAVY